MDDGAAGARGKAALETELYPPVKAFLEGLGFAVKGEVGGCDLLALREGEPPLVVIGELKLALNLELVLQGVDRMAAADEVWLAVPASRGGRGREADTRLRRMLRMLGLGLLVVGPGDIVTPVVDPSPYTPRKDKKRRSRLVAEHRRRLGDPVAGGGSRSPQMTAYRQQALRLAAALSGGAQPVKALKAAAPDAAAMLRRNVYGWFTRQSRGVYALTEEGAAALARWPQAMSPASAVADK